MELSKENKISLEKGINDVTAIAFSAGYMKALKDVLARTNGKVASEISTLFLSNASNEAALEFINRHPFKFKS